MAYLIAAPETMAATATDLAGMGSALSEAHMAAAPPTVGLVPAAADEVSAGVAHLFSRYAEDYHALAGRAAAFHERFVQHVTAGAGSYAGAEAANAAQVAPWQQSLFNLSSKLAAALGRSPVTTPLTGDPDLKSQTTINFGAITRTSLSDPDDNFDSISWSIGSYGGVPLVTDTLTSGFESTLRLGAPGQTINTLQSPARQAWLQALNMFAWELAHPLPYSIPPPLVFHPPIISLPVTDPLARLFWALLPLGF